MFTFFTCSLLYFNLYYFLSLLLFFNERICFNQLLFTNFEQDNLLHYFILDLYMIAIIIYSYLLFIDVFIGYNFILKLGSLSTSNHFLFHENLSHPLLETLLHRKFHALTILDSYD